MGKGRDFSPSFLFIWGKALELGFLKGGSGIVFDVRRLVYFKIMRLFSSIS